MINFTVGPVQSSNDTLRIGAEQTPYFRTEEFSAIMLENEKLLLEFAKAPEGSRAVFMTCSGTGSMEASIMNTLNEKDKAIVVDGGSFGHRFDEILSIHKIQHSIIKLEHGKSLKKGMLAPYENQGFTAFVVNLHETSTGVLYDLKMISDFCERNRLFLIVDSISSFLADPFDMSQSKVDIMITGSQKALACPPGISIIAMSPRAIKRIENNNPNCLYFDLKSALKNQERGQTPFTPAVSILRQINERLKAIRLNGGAAAENKRIGELASYFREGIKKYPFEIVSESMSNAVTPLHPISGRSAYEIFLKLKDNYGIWVCPNGGDMKDSIFRVGHIGYLSFADYDVLFDAFEDMMKRGLL